MNPRVSRPPFVVMAFDRVLPRSPLAAVVPARSDPPACAETQFEIAMLWGGTREPFQNLLPVTGKPPNQLLLPRIVVRSRLHAHQNGKSSLDICNNWDDVSG